MLTNKFKMRLSSEKNPIEMAKFNLIFIAMLTECRYKISKDPSKNKNTTSTKGCQKSQQKSPTDTSACSQSL